MFVYLLQLTLVASVLSYQSPSEYTLNSIDSFAPEELPPNAGSTLIGRAIYHDTFKFAVDILNNRTCPGLAHLLPNTKLNLFAQTDRGLASTAIKQIIALGEMGENFVIGAPNTGTAIPMSIVGDVYDFAILSSFAPSSILSDKRNFPNFSRITSSTAQQVAAIHSSLVYIQQQAGKGWTDVAILASVSDLDIDYATEFITQSSPEITILAYQQFLIEEDYFDIQVREVKESGARVIFAPILADYDLILEEADKLGLVGESYVWIVTASSVYLPPSQPVPLARGTISCLTYTPPTSELRECFSEAYRNADPAQYFGAGKEPTVQEFPPFDAVVTAAFVLHELDQMEMLDGRKIPGALWSSLIRNVTWNGLTGDISFDENGDREGKLEIVYYSPPVNDYISAAVVDPYGTEEPEFISSIVWFSNTTEFPDLDIREPFHYWSCHDAKLKYDSTGKTVVLQSPDGSNIDEIASFYHCDHFIDCQNISDESADCGTNFTILFIVMGIIVVICMIIASLLIVFVIIFGIILKYRRLRCASPFFLILLLISIIIGYSSIFAWFGKPHPVACAFQPWLLGLPAISMIVALSAKNFRLYRIFKYPMSRTKISDLELFLLWCTFMIPAVLILTLWAIISTPTSDMETINGEDHQHYVCTTGGFTGEPGGIIFFSIFVAYSAFILLIGAAVSILTRNIPSSFNESTLLTISIYNLGFLSVVMIPVILVVQSLNPFISWILRTCAILYAFTATMVIQFLPIVVGIFILDKGKNVTVFKSSLKFGTNQNSSPKSKESSGSPSPLHTQ